MENARDTSFFMGIASIFNVILLVVQLLADSCDTWELLALEVLEHSTTTS